MSILCPLEKPIPPEALPSLRDGNDQETTALEFIRFVEQVDSGLIWDPDTTPQSRLLDEEAIQLEIRGINSHPAEAPEGHKVVPPTAEFWRKQTVHKNSVAAKLRVLNMDTEAEKLENCHSYYTICQCNDCGAVRKFPNRCDLFYCPECQPGLARDRESQVHWWTSMLSQPKHVILTLKNVPDFNRAHLDQLTKWFLALRRRKFTRNWIGGFWSVEVTNEGRGWHIHLHALIEAKWIDSGELALQWDSITNHMGRIVCVRDCRGKSYLQEVMKYAVKGSQLAAWSPEQIRTFIRAVDGKHTFGVFGKLWSARTEFAEFIATMKAAKPRCDCGGCNQSYYSETEWTLRELRQNGPAPSRAPPNQNQQPTLLDVATNWTP